jgi:positive regulator of sigma E activity
MIVNYEENLEKLKTVNLEKSKNLRSALYFYVANLVLILLIIFIPMI